MSMSSTDIFFNNYSLMHDTYWAHKVPFTKLDQQCQSTVTKTDLRT